MQLHIKTQAANKNWSYEEQTGHTPDGYVGIPNVHNGSLLQVLLKRVELVCKEKDGNDNVSYCGDGMSLGMHQCGYCEVVGGEPFALVLQLHSAHVPGMHQCGYCAVVGGEPFALVLQLHSAHVLRTL